jgi:HEPN domain-containing protein
LQEAQALFDQRHYSGAYYLAGYAVECALKSCICKKTRSGDFPPDRKALENIYTHDLEKLVKGAELQSDHQARIAADKYFAVNWALVKDWSEQSRYERYTRKTAKDFLRAVTDPANGVMQWLAAHW